MQKINLILALIALLLTEGLADKDFSSKEMENLEVAQFEPTAVSKVKERFLALSQSTEEEIEPSSVYNLEETSEESTQTEQFETPKMEYPEDEENLTEESKNETALMLLESNARKVIAEETKKVEEAKENALKRISEVMRQFAEERKSLSEPNF